MAETEKPDELKEIKADKLYDGELTYDEIKNNPILHPIFEVYTIYESMGQFVQRSVAEYDRIKLDIQERIKENTTYSQTMLVAKLSELITHSTNVIFSQDVQRRNIKQAMNEMVKLVKQYYEPKEESKPVRTFEQVMDIPPALKPKLSEKEKLLETSVIPKKGRGRPPKKIAEEKTEEISEELLEKEEEKINEKPIN